MERFEAGDATRLTSVVRSVACRSGARQAYGRGMDMTHTTSHGETGIHMKDGDDFVCPNCGCEIRLIHHGDPAKMPNMQMFTCCCGTKMEKEHPDR